MLIKELSIVRKKKSKGVVLIAALWVLIILEMLAISLAKTTRVDIALSSLFIAKTKSKTAAVSGYYYALDKISKDSQDKESSLYDTIYSCAIPRIQNFNAKEIFSDVSLESGSFSLKRVNKGSSIDSADEYSYGLADEESKLNLNAMNKETFGILNQFLELTAIDRDAAMKFSYSLIDWIDKDDNLVDETFGAENRYYQSIDNPYKCKNNFLDSLPELFLIKGMTEEIYAAIKDHVTIYPKDNNFYLNFDTANIVLLKAMFRSYTGAITNTDIVDADSLADKIIAYRSGPDQIENTSDDRIINFNEMDLNSKERVLFLVTNKHRKKLSNYININVVAKDSKKNIKTIINVIVDRKVLMPVFWQVK